MSVKVKVGQTRNVRLVATGEKRPSIVPDSIALGSDTTGEYVRAIDAGIGIVVTPETDTESANLVISHEITTTEVNTNNGSLEFIQNANIDQFGHITAFASTGLNANNFTSSNNVISSQDIILGSTPITLGETTDELRDLSLVEVGGFTITGDEIYSDANTVQFTTSAPLGVFDFGTRRIVNVDNPVDDKDVVNKRHLEFELDRVQTVIKVFDDPILETDATNKRYVDNLAKGLVVRPQALAATTQDLGGTYDSGNSSFDATITIPPVNVLYIDDVTTWDVGDNLLVKDQNNSYENGSYDLIQVGDATTEWIFQRTYWSNESSELPGSYEFVTDGTVNGGTGWVVTVNDASTFRLGIDAINWSQFQGEGTYNGGRGLTLNGTTFSVDKTQDIEVISGTGAIKLPVGNVSQRPTEQTGMVRFNVEDGQFEGYDGVAWAGLGGVIDVDQDTKIIAENTPGDDNDELKFYTGGSLAAKFGANTANFYGDVVIAGNIQIGDADTDSITVSADFDSNLVPDIDRAYTLGTVSKNWNKIYVDTLESSDGIITVGGTGAIALPTANTSQRPSGPAGMLRFNSDEARFEGYDGTIWSGLAGSVIDLDKNTYIIAETSAGADNNDLDFYTDGVQRAQIDEAGTFKYGAGLNQLTIDYTTGNLFVNSKVTALTDLVLDPVGNIDVANNIVTGLADPVNPSDAVNLRYIETSFEAGLTVVNQANTFTDATGINLLANPTFEFGDAFQVEADSANNELSVALKNTGVQAETYGKDGFSPRIRITEDGRIDFATDIPIELQANAIPNFTETSRDIIALMFTDSTAHEGVTVVNDDDNDTINLFANNFDITLQGDIVGTAEVTRLTDTTITATLNTQFVDEVRPLSANAGIIVTDVLEANSAVVHEFLSLDYDYLNTRYITTEGGTSSGDIAAPRFVDSDNTNFFLDPAGTSELNKLDLGVGSTFSQIRFRDGPGSFSTMYGQGGKIGYLDNTFNYAAYSDRSTGDWVVRSGDVQAERCVDVDATNYFLHPGGTDSYLKQITIEDKIVATQIETAVGGVTIDGATGISLQANSNDINVNSSKITNVVDPTNLQDAATKAYVDSVAQGLRVIPAALAGTTEDLGATFNAGDNTLTSVATEAFALDGVTDWAIGDRVLVKDQTNPEENGSYEVTVVGDGSTAWVLTRGEYFNETSEIPGAFQFITDGTINNGTGWVAQVTDAETFALNTDSVTWYQFSGAGTYSAGTGLTLTGTEFAITNPNISFAADNGSNDVVTLGETLTIAGGEGVDTTVSDNNISIAVNELDGGTF